MKWADMKWADWRLAVEKIREAVRTEGEDPCTLAGSLEQKAHESDVQAYHRALENRAREESSAFAFQQFALSQASFEKQQRVLEQQAAKQQRVLEQQAAKMAKTVAPPMMYGGSHVGKSFVGQRLGGNPFPSNPDPAPNEKTRRADIHTSVLNKSDMRLPADASGLTSFPAARGGKVRLAYDGTGTVLEVDVWNPSAAEGVPWVTVRLYNPRGSSPVEGLAYNRSPKVVVFEGPLLGDIRAVQRVRDKFCVETAEQAGQTGVHALTVSTPDDPFYEEETNDV